MFLNSEILHICVTQLVPDSDVPSAAPQISGARRPEAENGEVVEHLVNELSRLEMRAIN